MIELEAGPRRRLALVDDSAEFRAIVNELAEPLGWEVHEFASGQGFLAALGRGLRPDLVMLDIVMPGMDGIESTREFAATSVRCPLVLTTGRKPLYAQVASLLAHTQGLEIVGILQKPVPIRDLRDALAPVASSSP